ncbi:RidA family protein [Nocardioides pyridinolyticus]
MESQDSPSRRLAELGIELPPPPSPVGSYVPAVRQGDTIRTTGQLAFVDGALVATGTVGVDVDVATAARAARAAALNAVSAAASLAGGIDRITRVLGLTGHIACPAGFTDHPAVMNGASDVLLEVFGEAGRHVRTNVGSSALPLGSPVEIELLVECAP